MRITVLPDREALDRAAADVIWEAARAKPDLLICLASGGTPTGTYALLADAPERLADARYIQLDEWAGPGPDDPASCAAYLERTVRGPLAVPPERWIGIRGDAEDEAAECRRVAAALEATGPIDLCILGLGLNGHLALNEPAESFDPFCHVATLSERSRTHPMLVGAAAPVRHGLTLGLGDILRARRILLIVSGAAKREPLARLAARRVTPTLPASFLWLHGDAVCLCDSDAAADIEHDDAEP
ncbi:MAG: 6-phosphogluconolactonase [Rhodospirillaceae bacterium]|nr:6-phosphogluconolactonase [Rhodospirillaceae bacterium]